MSKKLKIEITKQTLEDYNKYYFKKYPKRKKEPIPKPIPPSLNQWMVMIRPQMNNEKQKWKDFGIWLIEQYGYQDMQIEKCKITFKYYFPTKLRRDADNYTPKNLFDAFTASGMLVDDDFKHIEMLSICGGYDKENPRTEILIEIMEEIN